MLAHFQVTRRSFIGTGLALAGIGFQSLLADDPPASFMNDNIARAMAEAELSMLFDGQSANGVPRVAGRFSSLVE